MEKPILYIHSRTSRAGIPAAIKDSLTRSFGDLADLTFDEENGLRFNRFLEKGVPRVYLTDWASTLWRLDPKPMMDIFNWIKREHSAVKVVVCDYLSDYEEFLRTGRIDRLLNSPYLDFLAEINNSGIRADIATIRSCLV